MLFKKNKIEKSVAATFYPAKILIVTMNQKDSYVKYQTDSVTVLPDDCTDIMLGETIIKHLNESETADISFDKMKELRVNLAKISKIKPGKASMIGARYVSVFMDEKEISFTSYQNMLAKKLYEFYRIPSAITSISNKADFSSIGIELRKAWERCTFAEG
ncbi:MAG TPA: hypothetical protein VK772_16800 [Puia sp.]|nr:hypothetical protein [Puia sp.]